MAAWTSNTSRRVYAAWGGSGSDNIVYFSCFDGKAWDYPEALAFIQTALSPSLACYDGEIMVSWKELASDKLYRMLYNADGNPIMKEPHELRWRGESGLIPALAELDGVIYAAWKAKGDSRDLWHSSWSRGEQRFAPVRVIPDVPTRAAPSLARWRNGLAVGWVDEENEKSSLFKVGGRE
ncbi:hypothetical protein OQA88_10526 [Cercophora sp. LCS_1]